MNLPECEDYDLLRMTLKKVVGKFTENLGPPWLGRFIQALTIK